MEHSILATVARSCSVAVIEDGHWKPGIGDPNVMGWITLAAYVVAGALCIRAAAKTSGALPPH